MGRGHQVKIQVKVIPNSRTAGLTMQGDRFTVRVKEAPREGLANRAVMRLLAQHFKIPQSSVKILSGHSNRDKIIEILKKKQ